eukprot:NODE_162_length_16547_cov_0.334326.p7 type:complete len:230 gc:universal NODE_162_length_16547_cov_0.334326:11507-12196(+)
MESSFFRFINEQLYSSSSLNVDLSTAKMELYHKGFASQCKLWEKDPLFIIYQLLNSLFKAKVVSIVDFGAGEGILSSTLYHYKCLVTKVDHKTDGKYFKIKPNFKARISAFDLYPINDFVQAGNSLNLPLPSRSCHAAVFCLSLMGTDYSSFLVEANRILKQNGFVLIAEVQSRLVGCKLEFVKSCNGLGWKLVKQLDESHFCVFIFQKCMKEKDYLFPELRPCLYKKR